MLVLLMNSTFLYASNICLLSKCLHFFYSLYFVHVPIYYDTHEGKTATVIGATFSSFKLLFYIRELAPVVTQYASRLLT